LQRPTGRGRGCAGVAPESDACSIAEKHKRYTRLFAENGVDLPNLPLRSGAFSFRRLRAVARSRKEGRLWCKRATGSPVFTRMQVRPVVHARALEAHGACYGAIAPSEPTTPLAG
jgi:hypothetical protein